MSDYAATEQPTERILWGRVAALGAIVVLAFLLGRATVDEGAPRTELDQAQAAVVQLTEENAGLQRQLATISTSTQEPPAPLPADAAPPDSGGSSVLEQPQADEQVVGDGGESTGANDGASVPGAPGTPGEDGAAGAAGERAYRVRSGDSLASIATKLYGDEQNWRLIADANQLAANQLTVGQLLRIPAAP